MLGHGAVMTSEGPQSPMNARRREAVPCLAFCTFLQRWRILSFGLPLGKLLALVMFVAVWPLSPMNARRHEAVPCMAFCMFLQRWHILVRATIREIAGAGHVRCSRALSPMNTRRREAVPCTAFCTFLQRWRILVQATIGEITMFVAACPMCMGMHLSNHDMEQVRIGCKGTKRQGLSWPLINMIGRSRRTYRDQRQQRVEEWLRISYENFNANVGGCFKEGWAIGAFIDERAMKEGGIRQGKGRHVTRWRGERTLDEGNKARRKQGKLKTRTTLNDRDRQVPGSSFKPQGLKTRGRVQVTVQLLRLCSGCEAQ
jgi:hypothetical protein